MLKTYAACGMALNYFQQAWYRDHIPCKTRFKVSTSSMLEPIYHLRRRLQRPAASERHLRDRAGDLGLGKGQKRPIFLTNTHV